MISHHLSIPTTPSRVVVLGGSGFVGGDLVAHLREQRVPVVGFASRTMDLLHSKSVEQLYQTVHPGDVLVVASSIAPEKGEDIRTMMRNLTMGKHVADFLQQSACSHVVYISSDAVYDDAANPVREDAPCNPASLHGVMHLARERMLAQAVRNSKTPLLVLRATPVYGPNDTLNEYGPNRFVRSVLREQRIQVVGEGEDKRDHLYIRDLSRLIGLGILHRSEGVLNAASGQSASFRHVAECIVQCHPGTRLESLPRASSIMHRHFDVAATFRAFPTMRFTLLRVGLMAMTTTLAAELRGNHALAA